MPGTGSVLQEVAAVLSGQGVAVQIFAVVERTLVGVQQFRFGPIQFGGGEAVAAHPFYFRQGRAQAGENLARARLHGDILGVDISHQLAFGYESAQKGGIGFSGDIVEPVVQHHVEQAADDGVSVASEGARIAGGQFVVDLGKCQRHFGICEDQIACIAMIGHRVCEPGPGTLRRRQVAEMLDNLRFHVARIDIAHCDHRHQIGPVPVTVETAQRCRRRVADDFQVADRGCAQRSGIRPAGRGSAACSGGQRRFGFAGVPLRG